MAKLENPKHDEFARLLAQGLKQGDAYIKAGYSENKGAASRLAGSPKVQDRVEELRAELNQKISTAMAVVSEENWQSLADMGLTMEWLAQQYKVIYEQSLAAGSFSASNAAVQNIQKLIEIERNGAGNEDKADDSKIDVDVMFGVLDKVGDLLKLQQPAVPDEIPVFKDITPGEIE